MTALAVTTIVVLVTASPPVDRATVSLGCGDGSALTHTVTVGVPGEFASPCVPVVLRASADGYVDAVGSAGSPGAVVSLSLAKPAILELPRGASRATAAAWYRKEQPLERFAVEEETDTLAVSPGAGCLVLLRPGFVAACVPLVAGPGQRLAIASPRWEAGADLRGAVADGSGIPLTGARVELVQIEAAEAEKNDPCVGAVAALGLRESMSTEGGTFGFSGVGAGAWLVRAELEGFARGEQRAVVDLTVSRTVALSFVLRPQSGILAEVDPSLCGEEPPFELVLEREVITSERADERWKTEHQAVVGKELRASLDALAPGLYRLTLRKVGSEMVSKTIHDLPSGQVTRITLRPAPITVQGTVRQEGRAVDGASVTLRREGVEFRAVTDTQGAYEVRVWNPAWYSMTVQPNGAETFLPEVIDLQDAGGGDVVRRDIDLPERSLAGLVVDRASKEPVPGARVRIDEVRRSRGMASQRAVSTGADGRFTARFLSEDATISLKVDAEGYLPQRLAVGQGGVPGPEVVVELERGQHVRGRVTGPAGEPVAGATVMVFADSLDRSAAGTATTLADGSFALSARRGTLLWVVAQSYGIGAGVASEDDVTVRIPGLSPSFEAVVKTGKGDPVAGIALTLMRPDGIVIPLRVLSVHAMLHGGRYRSDDRGRLILTGVSPGTYQAVAVNLAGPIPLPLVSVPAPSPVELHLPGV